MENAILTRVIEISAFSAVIFLAVLLFRRVMKQWLSAQMRYLLWFLVVVRLLVPVTLESGVRLILLPTQTPLAAQASPSPAPDARPVGFAAPENGGANAQTADEPALPNAAARQPAMQTAARRPLALSDWLLIAWGAGACLVLAAHVALAVRLDRRIRALGRAPEPDVLQLYARTRKLLGIRAKLRVVRLPDIASPALTAQLRPKLLLPDSLALGGTREDAAFSLIHELMHYKRRDHLVCLLLTALRIVWWFNPVVWALAPLMRIDMESACDAQVVRKMDKQQKLQYAGLLLELGAEE